MKVTILCSSATHPVNQALEAWARAHAGRHETEIVRSRDELKGGDLLFLVSCTDILSGEELARYGHAFVLHASDLPKGRGWSPHIWSIIGGADQVTVTLLEADVEVDKGAIWKKERVSIPKHALHDEINSLLFDAELRLMDFALSAIDGHRPEAQDPEIEPDYCRRRTPRDSELDPDRSIAEQFDLLRVCDPERYPAWFRLRGHTYKVVLEKMDEDE